MVLLPYSVRRAIYVRCFGFDIDATAYIGMSVLLCSSVSLGAHSRIGNLNVIKGLNRLDIGAAATVGNLNWITGFPLDDRSHFGHAENRDPSFLLGDHAALTNRHLIDCTARVSIGRFSTFAGFRSQLLTHSIDLSVPRQDCAAVEIGEYCFIGTGCIILAGSKLPDRSVLAAGSLLKDRFDVPQSIYAGSPARQVKSLDADLGYYRRTSGYVV